MNSPRFAALAAKLLTRATPPAPALNKTERGPAIAWIERALAQKARRRGHLRWAVGAIAVLAVAAASLLLIRLPKSAVAPPNTAVVAGPRSQGSGPLTDSGSEPLRNGSPLPPGGRLISDAQGGATLRLPTGTEIAIEHGASLAFSDADPTEHFILSHGSIRAHVAKLSAHERFVVSTPDVEVEVRGTVFTVGVAESKGNCAAATLSRVAVSEGVVEVRSSGQSWFVHPGEAWPAGCSLTAASRVVHQERIGARSVDRDGRATPAVGTSHSAPGVASSAETEVNASRLAAQNDLFSEGVAARRAGESARALGAFEALLARYPASALAESARAERMRVLAVANRAAARRAATEYLARYPLGFARYDAEAILAQP